MLRRMLALSLAAVVAVGGALTSGAVSVAAPPTASWSASAGGEVATVGLSVTGLTLANARLANSSATSSSTATPRSQSISRNLAAAVAGLPIAVASNSQTAPPDNPGPVSGGLAAVSALGIGINALSTSNEAHWAGDTSCVTGTRLSGATTTTAGLSINPLGLANLLTTGVSSTTGTTALVSTGGTGLNRAVQSQARGSVTGVSVLGGAVTVDVVGQAVLTSTAAGATGNAIVAYTAPIVRVTEGGNTQTVALGSSTTLDLGAVGAVQVAVNNPTVTTAANGTTATASVNVVTLVVRAGPAALPVANSTIQLVPLRASAVAPSGGIDCPPPAPEIAQPADNSLTNDPTPTFSGTGTAGATVDLTLDGTSSTAVATVTGGGTWSYTPTAGLSDGPHTASVTQTLNGSTSPPSAEVDFTVDTTPPAAPVITDPANRSVIDDATPTIAGTGPANTTVEVFVDGGSIGTTTTSGTGAWQLTSPTLTSGPHATYAVATDPADNDSPPSDGVTFTVDTDAPDAPVITTPADQTTITGSTLTVTGQGEADATVTVSIDGTEVGTATVTTDGRWTVPITTPLADGPHTVTAIQTDVAGNDSDPTENAFVVDTTAPDAPTVTAPTEGSTTGASPTIRGTAEADATVEVFVDGTSIGTITATDGDWELVVPTALASGSHEVYAVATDAVDNVSDPSETVVFTVDVTAPAAPTILVPADGSATNDPTPTFSGTAESGATVEVFVDGASVGTTTATGGSFSLTAPSNLTDGSHLVRAVATDATGNISASSPNTGFRVDTAAPSAPTVTAPAAGAVITDTTPDVVGRGEVGATVRVDIDGVLLGETLVGGDGTWSLPVLTALSDGPHTVSVVQTDAATNASGPGTSSFVVDSTAPAAPVITDPAEGATTAAVPTVVGTADPASEVEVTVDGVAIGRVTPDGDGRWSLTVPRALTSGAHTVSAVARDAVGNTSGATDPRSFTVDADAPAAPVVLTPADGSATPDTTPAYTGTAEAGSSVEVFVDGRSVGSVTATEGRFSITPDVALDSGPHQVRAVATDTVGNVSTASATNRFTVDTTAPAAPVITGPQGRTDDPRVTVRGTAEPGTTVTVVIDDRNVGTAPADEDGRWTFGPTGPLAVGDHRFSATARDAAGNVSPRAAVTTLTVVAIADPRITAPAQDAVVDRRPTISGTGEPGATIVLRWVSIDEVTAAVVQPAAVTAGERVGTTTVADDGGWSVRVPETLDPGAYSVRATQSIAPFADRVSDDRRFRVVADQREPETPVVEPSATDPVSGTPFEVCGTGEPGAELTLLDEDGARLGTTTVGEDGRWCLTIELEEGEHRLTAVQGVLGTQLSSDPIVVVVRAADVEDPGPQDPDGTPGGSGSDHGPGSHHGGGAPELAGTGGPGVGAALVGLVLLVFGAGITTRRGGLSRRLD